MYMRGCAIDGNPSPDEPMADFFYMPGVPQVWCVIAAATCTNFAPAAYGATSSPWGSETNFMSLSREIEGGVP
jgi:hypothetical protein